MIKLTTVINSVPPVYNDLYVNPKHIVTIKGSETSGGCLYTILGGIIHVKETPEEIIVIINQK